MERSAATQEGVAALLSFGAEGGASGAAGSNEPRPSDKMLRELEQLAALVVAADQALAEVCNLTSSNVFKMASKPAKVQHGVIKAVLCSLVDRKAPDMDTALGDKTIKSVTDPFQYFARHTSAADSETLGVTVTGAEAMAKWFAENQEKKVNGRNLNKNRCRGDESTFVDTHG